MGAVQSRSNAKLVTAVLQFARRYPESLILTSPGGPGLTPADGSLGVHRLTFTQFARQAALPRMAELGLAPLSMLASEALAAHVAFRAREARSLRYFEPVAALPGFSRALARTLRDLRLAGASPRDLEIDAAAAQDLSGLLEDYERELEERGLADLATILSLARAAADEGEHRWANLPIASLDVPLPSRAHRDLFDTLIERAPEVLTAVSGPDEPGDDADSLSHLRRYLFAPEPVAFSRDDGRFELFSAPGENLEAVEIARRIHALAREGVRFDQIAILLRNPERYQPMVEDALRRAGIPAYFSRGAKRPDPAGRAFLALLCCAAEHLSASRFAEYVSIGQVPREPVPPEWVAPEDETEKLQNEPEPAPDSTPAVPRRWEQYLVDAAVIGGRDRWERRLAGLEAEWAITAEEHPERLAQLRHLKEFALPLINALAELPRAVIWKEWLEKLRDLARRGLREPDGVLAALAELEPMGEVGPASLEEVIETLTDRLRFLRREPPLRRWGRVCVSSIDEARGQSFRAVFLPGLAEGLFPQRMSEDPLLLDEFRRAIANELPTRHDLVQEERERLHLAVAAAEERLIASYPRMEVAEARPRVPSFYALELPRAIFGGVPELSVFETRAREAAPARLNWPAPRETSQAIDDTEYDLASISHKVGRHILESNPHAARSLRARFTRWRAKWQATDGLVGIAPQLMEPERLLARTWSPSTLETFAACPYKFALRGIFGLREREEPVALEQLDPRTRGILFHEVQRDLYRGLKDAGMLPVTPETAGDGLKRLEEVLARVAARYEEKLAPAIPRVWASEIDGLRTDLRGWLQFTASNEHEWEPIEFERPFKDRTILDRVQLRGQIDAIEKRGDHLRVTDYKTGKPPDTIPRWVGGGQHLQPLIYALVVEAEFQAKVDSGRLLYATQRGGYLTVEIPLDQKARLFLTKLLEDLDGMIAGGFLPPVPAKDACTICDYRVVCGPYEERRLLKKDVRDERLDALFEIRGMA
jgi:CRISPR/Cas system-associated exonuclease Cas4 (RecB family)